MGYDFLLSPPAAFLLCLAAVWLFSRLTARLRPSATEADGKTEPYACGETVPAQKAEPEYEGFFQFAVFFTVLHVAGLMIATWSIASGALSPMLGIVYIATIALTLAILFLG